MVESKPSLRRPSQLDEECWNSLPPEIQEELATGGSTKVEDFDGDKNGDP